MSTYHSTNSQVFFLLFLTYSNGYGGGNVTQSHSSVGLVTGWSRLGVVNVERSVKLPELLSSPSPSSPPPPLPIPTTTTFSTTPIEGLRMAVGVVVITIFFVSPKHSDSLLDDFCCFCCCVVVVVVEVVVLKENDGVVVDDDGGDDVVVVLVVVLMEILLSFSFLCLSPPPPTPIISFSDLIVLSRLGSSLIPLPSPRPYLPPGPPIPPSPPPYLPPAPSAILALWKLALDLVVLVLVLVGVSRYRDNVPLSMPSL